MNYSAPIKTSTPQSPSFVLAAFLVAVSRQPFYFFMAAVTAISVIYYGLLASPLYVSEMQLSLQGRQQTISVPMLSSLLGQSQGGGLSQSIALSQYIKSGDMLQKLQATHDLRRLYSIFRLDPLYHMSQTATDEEFLAFYNRMVSVSVDTDTNILTVDVKSFDAKSAAAQARDIQILSTHFMNDMSQQIRAESTRAARSDLTDAQREVLQTTKAITDFRRQSGNMDPISNASGNSQAMLAIQNQIYSLQSQLASTLTYSTTDSPQVKQINAQVTALQKQVAGIQASLVGKGDNMSQTLGTYQDLLNKQIYAQQRLTVSLASYDQARSNAAQMQTFVVPVVNPNLPTMATEPQRILSILSVLLVAATIYGIIGLIIANIRDHLGV